MDVREGNFNEKTLISQRERLIRRDVYSEVFAVFKTLQFAEDHVVIEAPII